MHLGFIRLKVWSSRKVKFSDLLGFLEVTLKIDFENYRQEFEEIWGNCEQDWKR